MDYKTMSYGRKLNFKSNTQFETALNATISRNLIPNTAVSQTVIDNYRPFVRFHFENRNSTVTIRLCIDGQALGDNTIQFSKREWYIQPLTAIDILPEEDNLQFTRVAIVNTHASTNTSNNDLIWDIANY